MKKILKNKTIEAALITAFFGLVGVILIIYFQQPTIQQTHSGDGDNVTGDKTVITNNGRAVQKDEILPFIIKEFEANNILAINKLDKEKNLEDGQFFPIKFGTISCYNGYIYQLYTKDYNLDFNIQDICDGLVLMNKLIDQNFALAIENQKGIRDNSKLIDDNNERMYDILRRNMDKMIKTTIALKTL